MRKSLLIMKYLLAAVLLAMALVCSAKADTTDQVTFTVNVTTGSQSGDTFTGSFTYDATTLAMTGQTSSVLSFTFTAPAWAGQTLSSTGLIDHGVDDDGLPLVPAELTGFFFAPAPVGGTDNAFVISQAGYIYGSTTIVGTAFTMNQFGSVTYSTPEPVTAPEPSSLALIPLGLGALLVMQKRMGRSRPSVV